MVGGVGPIFCLLYSVSCLLSPIPIPMKIAVLGTGMVGNALATKLVQLGHQVMMGSRTANSSVGQDWLRSVGGNAKIGTFADTAAFGEVILDCTNGELH